MGKMGYHYEFIRDCLKVGTELPFSRLQAGEALLPHVENRP